MLGIGTRGFYSNTYDADIYDSDTWFQFDGTNFQAVSRYDNTGTDHIGVRAKRSVLGIALGGTYLNERNGWWVGFEAQEPPPVIEQYRIDSRDSASTWFEMGTSKRFISVDAAFKFLTDLSVFGEYSWTRYTAKWDAGNQVRKQGDVYVDGKIDVPVGQEDGTGLLLGFDMARGDLSTRFTYETEHHDGMGSGEAYVTSFGLPFEDPSTPLLPLYGPSILDYQVYRAVYTAVNSIETFDIFEDQGLPERKVNRGRFEVSGKAIGLTLGLDVDIAKREWDYKSQLLADAELTQTSILPSVSGNLFGEKFQYDITYEAAKDNLHPRMPSPYRRNTLLLRGDVGITDHWGVYCNLRRASYEWHENDRTKDRSFFDTHAALVWSPISRVEIRMGYGVNPIYYIDQSVEGREIGRERWMASYMWLAPTTSLIDAEKALEDVDMIFVMGVIAF